MGGKTIEVVGLVSTGNQQLKNSEAERDRFGESKAQNVGETESAGWAEQPMLFNVSK
jgi:hypothetical protein